jgi:hypothetical protein
METCIKNNKEKKMNENEQIQNEGEISLLDLFTVLLRYRKLIVGITLAFIILAAAGYILYPVYKYSKSIENNPLQGIMQMEIVQRAQPYASQGLENFILRPEIITEALFASGMEEFEFKGGKITMDSKNKSTVSYLVNLFWIQNLDLNGNIFIERGKEHKKVFNVRRIGSVIEVTLKDKNIEVLRKFMESIYKLSTRNVEENIRVNAQLLVANYERLMELPKVSESVQFILEKDFDTYTLLRNFLDGKETVVKQINEPIYNENIISVPLFRRQFRNTCVIIVFAGFFLAVMLAFALNAVHNIKNDEEAMKKIKDALGNSGGK